MRSVGNQSVIYVRFAPNQSVAPRSFGQNQCLVSVHSAPDQHVVPRELMVPINDLFAQSSGRDQSVLSIKLYILRSVMYLSTSLHSVCRGDTNIEAALTHCISLGRPANSGPEDLAIVVHEPFLWRWSSHGATC